MGRVRVGYVRTFKKDQNPELQRRDLLAAGCEKLFEERISSRKADRPELKAALGYVREGDALVVWKLDRFGRSLKELIELVGGLRERGAWFPACTGTTCGSRPCRPGKWPVRTDPA